MFKRILASWFFTTLPGVLICMSLVISMCLFVPLYIHRKFAEKKTVAAIVDDKETAIWNNQTCYRVYFTTQDSDEQSGYEEVNYIFFKKIKAGDLLKIELEMGYLSNKWHITNISKF